MKKMFRLTLSVLAMAFLMLSCGKAENDDNRKVLAVSLEPQRYLLEKIAGDNFRVVSLLSNGDNPETFEPSMQKRIDVDNSDVYFTIGYLPFEDNLINSVSKDVKVVKSTDGIKPLVGTHNCGHHHHNHAHADVDPHIWTSVRNARQMIRVMTNTLKEIDSGNASEYEKNFEEFDNHLDSLDKAYIERLSNAKGQPFMVWHPSLSYFAHDYGLHQIAVAQQNKENSMNALREVIDQARADSVKVFFFQREYDARQAEAINSEIGSRLITINPGAYDWENELNTIVNELCKP